MNKKQKRMVRIVAIVLAVLLAGSAIVSAVISVAYGEESAPRAGSRCELKMEYLENEQALRMSQRLVYTNVSKFSLDRVLFYAPANLFRRQSSLPYDEVQLPAALPKGYLPGGIDLESIRVNGEETDWGFQGNDEAFLRVACALAPGESCSFEFEYYLLLTENAAFLGVSEDSWRLSGFYFAPASLDSSGEFILNAPLSFTRWIDVPAMDFSATITLPKDIIPSGTGMEIQTEGTDDLRTWSLSAESVHDFALTLSRSLRENTLETKSGVQLRCLSSVRKSPELVLETAAEAIAVCETWFGPLPFAQLDFVQTAHGNGPLAHSACLWLPESLLREGGRTLEHVVRRFVAAQYFGCSAWARPVSDAWLTDALSEYIAYLILEESKGYDAYIAALNEDLVDSLQLTIPGGLNVTSDASLFTPGEYEIVILNRGAVVFHELYTAMGRENLISALGLFYRKGLETELLTEMDLVNALDEASGSSWEKFLTDWVFNIGEYVNQEIYWLE